MDDATVEIENINRNAAMGKEVLQAILDGAAQIAVPAFVSTLAICIVFVPMFFLTGVARYLFVPLAEAVSFAMLASYLLSRTLVPTMARYLLRGHEQDAQHLESEAQAHLLARLQVRFEHAFERLRKRYRVWLSAALSHRAWLLGGVLLAVAASTLLVPWIGQDFFPRIDSGQFTLHLRAPTGTRIEDTAELCDAVERSIRAEIPPNEVGSIIDNVGLPYSSVNLSYSNSAPIGTGDADIMVALNREHHPTSAYLRRLRLRLAREFPGVTFYFLASDMVTQILNFGLPAPINVQIVGQHIADNRRFAEGLLHRLQYIPGAVDLRIQEPFNLPRLQVNINRTRAAEVGYSARDVASDLLISLSGSFQTNPTYWMDPRTGVSYSITTQTPQYRTNSLQDLENIPLASSNGAPPQILGNLASISRGSSMAAVSHYNVQPVINIYGAVQGRDLGGVARDIDRIVDASQKDLPRGSRTIVRGQIDTMRSSFSGLLAGLVFSIVLVYLLIVVNFQSWLDPFDHHFRAARRTGRNPLVPVRNPHHLQRAGADWCNYVRGRRHLQQHPGGELRQGANGRGDERHAGGAGVRIHTLPPRDHDGTRHDHWYGAHGVGFGRGRRAERSPGPRRYRGVAVRYRGHAVLCADGFQPRAWRKE